MDGGQMLVDIVIIDPIRIDMVLRVVLFCGVAMIVLT
jgi:hypothetical protein